MAAESNIKIGVITVTYNSASVIEEFLDSCKKQAFDNFILYVIDNNSFDDTLKLIDRAKGQLSIKVIRNSENVGIAVGNNQGIFCARQDECSHYLLINNDTVFAGSLFVDLLRGLERTGARIVFPKMYYHDNPKIIWCAGGEFLRNRGFTAWHAGMNQLGDKLYLEDRQITYSPTCCALLTADVVADVGLMDSVYFVYFDDTDFLFRALLAKVSVFYIASAVIYHKVGSLTGGGESSPFALRYMTRNRVIFLRKHINNIFLRFFWVIHLQLQTVRDLVCRRVDFKGFVIMQRALLEGLKIQINADI